MAKLAPKKPLAAREVRCIGGPWHGLRITTRIPLNRTTLKIKVKSDVRVYNTGCYRMTVLDEAHWEIH